MALMAAPLVCRNSPINAKRKKYVDDKMRISGAGSRRNGGGNKSVDKHESIDGSRKDLSKSYHHHHQESCLFNPVDFPSNKCPHNQLYSYSRRKHFKINHPRLLAPRRSISQPDISTMFLLNHDHHGSSKKSSTRRHRDREGSQNNTTAGRSGVERARSPSHSKHKSSPSPSSSKHSKKLRNGDGNSASSHNSSASKQTVTKRSNSNRIVTTTKIIDTHNESPPGLATKSDLPPLMSQSMIVPGSSSSAVSSPHVPQHGNHRQKKTTSIGKTNSSRSRKSPQRTNEDEGNCQQLAGIHDPYDGPTIRRRSHSADGLMLKQFREKHLKTMLDDAEAGGVGGGGERTRNHFPPTSGGAETNNTSKFSKLFSRLRIQ